ncbi:MAG: metal ABC transporter ATP-binding protein [Bacillota bacterium]|uniref:Metal ABC transporter ATP-binding protein n=1 Tax=Virgibacillus salarius TaxID=447199 RepID=A0A941I8I5_9BACI|nr:MULTISPECIES: metal ABC transporter ATP-binding protein [Bacillaceae]NAZ07186.1 ATP-binding cassette domain-containing protein [Agaribacter marinus]MBR7794463.1 metal ABC transporter ATP-binding protein [Virgibacillus salarius]MCC2248798.1 metal ABC transporter ATP-binding protein [Virgibacillus sp. AGTR]MDY7043257.1 metal ABC transporter ATP-binding protein [Virgibacillus sp. M23]QRZ17913.1 metal ABC transporter ATP-binding protein [Virgibacillus sp. AGTR]
MAETIVTMKDIDFSYENKKVLDHINFAIPRGSFMGLIGPNGGGKTTLIKIILGLQKPDTGSVELFGQSLEHFSDWNKIGFVSQKANSFNKGFPATVFEVVSMGLTAKVGYFKFFTRKHKAKIIDAIAQVGMGAYTHENIGNLSGGQQQRIFIARALVNDPELLILDEPTVGVDKENVQRFYELLYQLNSQKKITMLMVTHDTGTMTKHATEIVCLNKTLHFHGNPEEYQALTDTDLSRLHGHHVNIITHDH